MKAARRVVSPNRSNPAPAKATRRIGTGCLVIPGRLYVEDAMRFFRIDSKEPDQRFLKHDMLTKGRGTARVAYPHRSELQAGTTVRSVRLHVLMWMGSRAAAMVVPEWCFQLAPA
jgi:hypothetical protein